jgi:ribonuclease Z
MGQVVILGSAAAVADAHHENTHMLLQTSERMVLVDCAGNPIVRLEKIGINPLDITDLILTHFHPDHVSTAPLLLMDMWLMGRKMPLNIYGLEHTLDRFEQLMVMYDWDNWPNFYPVTFNRLPEDHGVLALDEPTIRIFTSPVEHLIPTIGLRAEFIREGKSLAYSCDTQKCDQVVELAKDVDVLIHEAAGGSIGHTSPAQAGEVAALAGAKSLYLIHYQSWKKGNWDGDVWLSQAKSSYNGPVYLAEDFQKIPMD